MTTPPSIIAAKLSLAGVRHGFYGRRGGVSAGEFAALNCGVFCGDSPAAVATNRRRIADALGAAHLIINKQIHGARVRVVDADSNDLANQLTGDAFDGDGLVTAARGVALGVLTADCAPVLFADAAARVIGAAHAGWRGALRGVTDAVLAQMMQCGARRENIVGAVGPAIQLNSYQVGAEFVSQFESQSPINCAPFFRNINCDTARGEQYFDLPGYVQSRVQAAGVLSCEIIHTDTFADESFFSHRRGVQRGQTTTGRQLGAIVLT